MIRTTIFALLCLCLPVLAGAQDEVVITKTALKENPRLRVSAFNGSDDAHLALLTVLHYADWFTVVREGEADYLLAADCPDATRLTLELRNVDAKPLTRFTVTQKEADYDTLARRGVDMLIQTVFDNPGFCQGRIAFVYQSAGASEIWTTAFDGSGPEQVTFNRRLSVEPDWGPAARYLVYMLYNTLSTDIVLVDTARGRQRRISSFPGLNAGAALSPDRQHVALTLSYEGNVELYTITLNGGQVNRLTRTPGVEASPCWSPDGRRICYVSDSASHRPTLYVIPAGGGQPERVLRVPQEAVSPDWSPVSNKLCFAVRAGGRYTIAVLDMAAGEREPQVVVNADGDWEAPSWTADGRHLVCTRKHGGEQRLHLVDTWFGRLVPLRFKADVSLPACSGLPAD